MTRSTSLVRPTTGSSFPSAASWVRSRLKASSAGVLVPEDCAILICNMYYREIEAQLREMGLRNPVAYFNDECLPHFFAGKLPEGV